MSVLSGQARYLKINVRLAGRFLYFAICSALVIACAASLALWQADTRYEFDLLPKNMAHHDGTAFRVRVVGQVSWPWERAPDTISNLRTSRLILFEDGLPLGPPHQPHWEIINLGRGRYSHWNNFILFSASDNGDPRLNGRHYYAIDHARLRFSVAVLPWLLLLVWVVTGTRKVWAYAESRLARRLSSIHRYLEQRIGALGIFLLSTAPIVIIANIIVIRYWPLPAIITPDTALYLGFNEVRTFGYPVFLKTIILLLGDLRLLVAIQLNLLLGSIVLLGWAVAWLVGSLLCGSVLVLALALNPSQLNWTELLMTEGLFIPLLLAHAALVLLLLKRFSRVSAALASMTLVAAILVRPAAYSLLLNLPLLVLLPRGRRIAILAWAMIPAAAFYAAAAGAHKVALGTWQSQSFGGYTLLGKVALLIHGDVPGAPPIGEEIHRRIAAQVKEAETKRFPTEYWVYTANWYDEILYRKIAPVLSDYVKAAYPSETGDGVWRRVNSVAWSLAVRVIERDPIGYLKLVLAQYYGLWSVTLTASAPIGTNYVEDLGRSLQYLNENSILRSWAENVGLGEDTFLVARARYPKDSAIYNLLDPFLQTTLPVFSLVLVSVAVCVAFVCCPYWLWRLLTGRPVQDISAALLYLGVTLASYYLLVSSVEFALPRYAEAFEGITLTINVLAVSILVARVWTIMPAISSALEGVFRGKRSAEIASGDVSAAKIGRS